MLRYHENKSAHPEADDSEKVKQCTSHSGQFCTKNYSLKYSLKDSLTSKRFFSKVYSTLFVKIVIIQKVRLINYCAMTIFGYFFLNKR